MQSPFTLTTIKLENYSLRLGANRPQNICNSSIIYFIVKNKTNKKHKQKFQRMI